MLSPHEAGKMIAAASFAISRAKKADGIVKSTEDIQAAEHRLAVLLNTFLQFTNHPDFRAAYHSEIGVLLRAAKVRRRAASRKSTA